MPRLDREKLLTYRKQQDASPVATPADWALRRAEIQRGMQKVMGPLPDPSLRVPLAVEWLGDEDVGKYTRRKLTFATDPGDRVSAYLLVPKDLKKPAPAMLCLHPTGAPGKDIVTGLAGTASRHYAHELAERGYVCIVPDYPTFGGYSPDLAAYAAGERLNGQYCSGTMKAIWNNMRAIDLLETLPEVDADRIGAIGHSLGGHNALYTAAFELRIKAVVTSCGFTAFHDYYGGKLKGWTSDRYMPKIASEYESNPDRMPFDFHEVLGAIAPRSIFVCAPVNDHNFDVGGVRKVIASAIEVYKLLEVPDRLHVEYPDAAHDFPDAQRESAYAWLKEALKNKR